MLYEFRQGLWCSIIERDAYTTVIVTSIPSEQCGPMPHAKWNVPVAVAVNTNDPLVAAAATTVTPGAPKLHVVSGTSCTSWISSCQSKVTVSPTATVSAVCVVGMVHCTNHLVGCPVRSVNRFSDDTESVRWAVAKFGRFGSTVGSWDGSTPNHSTIPVHVYLKDAAATGA